MYPMFHSVLVISKSENGTAYKWPANKHRQNLRAVATVVPRSTSPHASILYYPSLRY